jgi:hypothetical protein
MDGISNGIARGAGFGGIIGLEIKDRDGMQIRNGP